MKTGKHGVLDLNRLLQALPAELNAEIIQGEQQIEINSVTADSRQTQPGSLFVAIRGTVVDGHDFIQQAASCSCIVVEDIPASLPKTALVRVNDSHAALGHLAAAFQGFPARSMTMIGLTGTNGKTTVSWMLEQMLESNGCRVGVIGTVNYRYPNQSGQTVVTRASLTTPDPVQLQQLLRTMADHQVTHVIIETSSHALIQGRLQGILFDIGVFTNLSRDHLDFHGSMDEYYAAKKLLFTRFLKDDGRGIIVTGQGEQPENWGHRLATELSKDREQITLLTCGFDRDNPVHAFDISMGINGFSCQLSLDGAQTPFTCPLTGRYNLLNVLAAAGVGVGLGLDTNQIVKGLRQLRQVPGRLERVGLDGVAQDEQPAVFVDYAHTPDALHNVLQTLKPLTKGRLICIFGCGGDRDQGKRALMGEVVAELADLTITTSDNPRSESQEAILDAIVAGLKSKGIREYSATDLFADMVEKGYSRVTDRKTAIHLGCGSATPEDIVLIAGKGHEDYQILGQKRIFFDDRIEAKNGLLRWNIKHLLKATGGIVDSRTGSDKHLLSDSVSTDTRTLSENDIYVALAGENFDGHDYVEQAVKAGASIVIAHRTVKKLPVDVIRVQDTEQALGDMAGYRRRLLGKSLKVAAITGSSGKTTVKEMTAAIFTVHLQGVETGIDPLLKTQGNFNNLIGLPLSLLPVESGHKMAVLEMGMNRPGEIERLTAIADPDVGCITNIQAAHLEGLGSIKGVAAAKGELFAGMRKDTIAVVNYDDPHIRKLAKNAATTVGFAITANGRRAKPVIRATRIVSCGEKGMRFTLHIGDWKQRFLVPAPGEHNVSNCAAAAAIAHAAGIDNQTIVTGLTSYTSVDKRMQFMSLPGGIQVVNDCYNANPASMAAALRTVSGFGEDCGRVALLGDMLELGSNSVDAHLELGRQVAQLGYDQLAITGSFAAHVAKGACDAGMAEQQAQVFSDTHAMSDWLYNKMVQGKITEGDWLLVKGSRGMRMETVLREIEYRFATGIEGGN